MFMNLMSESQNADIERYSDLIKPKTSSSRDSIYQILQINSSNFPEELVKDSRPRQKRKRVKWNAGLNGWQALVLLCISIHFVIVFLILNVYSLRPCYLSSISELDFRNFQPVHLYLLPSAGIVNDRCYGDC
ncbi:hypothetical protein JRO89_XS09G0189800 [Xanthoceras sorbifolium]|uniref:Uncharacterized protein n=1 Tax=Xanthoceras sorbifolium TaxID=99658 RepID=A0ABQ8HM41_9ROSI|nr:hypothetical protein JRO89_XS09G0189800 [Xanthoceras sorbifolium]